MSVPVHQDAYPLGGRGGSANAWRPGSVLPLPRSQAGRVPAAAIETATEDLLDRYEALVTELQRQIVTLRFERDQARRQLPAGTRTCATCAAVFAPLGRERVCRACRRQTAARGQERFKLKQAPPLPPPAPVPPVGDLRACRECATPFPRHRNKQLCEACVTAHRKRFSHEQYLRRQRAAKESV